MRAMETKTTVSARVATASAIREERFGARRAERKPKAHRGAMRILSTAKAPQWRADPGLALPTR